MKMMCCFALFCTVLGMLAFTACNNTAAQGGASELKIEASAEAVSTAQATPIANFNPSAKLVGMLVDKSDSQLVQAAAHGFLRTAENLGYPAKLYDVKSDEEAEAALQQAIEDGCAGLLVWADTAQMQVVARKAEAAGIRTIVPYFETQGVSANLAPDPDDFAGEAARIMCERIKEKGKDSGLIVITGAQSYPEIAQAFQSAIAQNYPQYAVESYASATESGVSQYIEQHAALAGVLGLEAGSAKTWNDACNAITKKLKPAATAAASAEPASQSPEPNQDDSYKRTAVIVALDYTQENLKLVQDGAIYALIARPYYDSAAQSMAVLDRLLRVLPTQTEVLLNAPIIRKNGLDKYLFIMSEVEQWFNGQAADEVEASTVPTASPALTATPDVQPSASAGD